VRQQFIQLVKFVLDLLVSAMRVERRHDGIEVWQRKGIIQTWYFAFDGQICRSLDRVKLNFGCE